MSSMVKGLLAGVALSVVLYGVPKVVYYMKVVFTAERILKTQHVPFSWNGLP